ncbi:hypothetical protein R3P38DRAFT_3104608 [Favolaschia claudopus]|uniref:Uncharacterized protein n=1 Tax=Favolaschia claudopus TaxID=2862362 RepID=A0AAV9ZJX8_9AGAR
MTQMQFKDISPDQLGPCNNPHCPNACGHYFPAPVEPGTLLVLTPCMWCPCHASQHVERRVPSVSVRPFPRSLNTLT